MSLYVGVDSGTQSVKAIALDLDTGHVVAEGRAPHHLIAGLPPGHMEQHPQEWAAAMDAAIGEVASRIDRSRVRGIGVSGQQHGFVPLDGNGGVIRPAKLWCDTSTSAECAVLTRRLGGPAAVIRKTGLPFLPGYTAPKVLWLKRREPANFKKLRHILLPHDYLNFHLTGNYFMEFGDASGTAFLDVRKRIWSQAAMNAVDARVASCLPALSPSHASCGTLRPEIAGRYGFPRGTIVSAGGGDNMMGAIGTGNVVPGAVTASFGTSGTIYAYARKPVVDPSGEIAAFCSSTGGWLPLLCTMNVTGVTEQVRSLFGWEPRGPREGGFRGAGGRRRPHAPPLSGRRAHAQPAPGYRRVFRARPPDAGEGPPRPGRDRGGDARDELRAAQARRARREGEGDPAHGRRRALPALAPGCRGHIRGSRRGHGPGRERRARRRPPGGVVRLSRSGLGHRARGALQQERLP
jgi:sugar (pentulose or hexulose) kinase